MDKNTLHQHPMRVVRKQRGIRLWQLAEAVGSDVGNLSRIERGEQIPKADLAGRILRYFDGALSAEDMLYSVSERYKAAAAECERAA